MARDLRPTVSGDHHRARWHREREQQWAYGLGAAVLAVLLPVAAGFPDPRIRFGEFRREVLISIIAAVLGAALLLALAAVIRRSGRAAWFGVAILVLLAGSPILDETWDGAPAAVAIGRVAAVAVVVVARCVTLESLPLIGRVVRDLAGGLAVASVGLEIIARFHESWAGNSTTLAASTSVLAVGSIDFIRGQRDTEGDVAAFGLSALSFGFGGLLLLASGGPQLTVGAACVAIVTAVCAVAASIIAVFEALAYREARVETMRLSEALAITRLNVQSTHLAQLAHDQRSALLAIEAAARRLQDNPSFELAFAVATEASRLRRALADEVASTHRFDVHATIEPMVVCMRSLGVPVTLTDSREVQAWGAPDDVVEIVRTLIDNAIVHGRGEVTVGLSRVGDTATVMVSDEGPGVPVALQESIFDRGVTTAPQSHQGLGLWSARQLAEAMGGSLRASTVRRSSFELTLRRSPPVDHSSTDSASPTPNEAVPLREAWDG